MRGRNFIIWFGVLATLLVVVLNLPEELARPLRRMSREVLAPYQEALTHFFDRTHQLVIGFTRGARLVEERDRLADEVQALRAQVENLAALGRENQELRAALQLARSARRPLVACRVIARDDGSGWWQKIRLNKGQAAGLRAGMAVITPAQGLVGRIEDVSAESCDVLLISDRTHKASVRFEPSGVFGVLRGGGLAVTGQHRLEALANVQPFVAEYIRQDAEIRPGQAVLTSGLGGGYPPGLLVGYVVRVAPDSSGLYQRAEVAPAADLARLRTVLVVVEQ